MAPRLVRRRTLKARILDFLLWLAEELESGSPDQWQQEWANPIGVLANLVFMIARANSGNTTRGTADDVFSEDVGHSGWLVWLVRKAFYTCSFSLLTTTHSRQRSSCTSSLCCLSLMLHIPSIANDIIGSLNALLTLCSVHHLPIEFL